MRTEEILQFFKILLMLELVLHWKRGLSNSLIRIYSLGIPTIATRVGGNSEITNIKNGFLIEVIIKNNYLKL